MSKKKQNSIETIVRGIWVHKGKVLLCQNAKHGYLFLPGGHIDPGEQAGAALVREMREELGVELAVGRFIGASEGSFMQKSWKTGKKKRHQEINVIFELVVPKGSGMDPGVVESQEGHIRFVWVPVKDLKAGKAGNVLPASAAKTIMFHVEHGCSEPQWASDWAD